MPRLVCIVEGHGDVEATAILCARIFAHLEAYTWFVDKYPVRQPRSKLVDETMPSPNRPASLESLRNAIALAQARPADAVLVVCDADDDCAAVWGPSASALVGSMTVGGAVMAVREYETWMIASRERRAMIGSRSLESIRGAKEYLRKTVADYKPTHHQAQLTRDIDIEVARSVCDSFDKLVRTLAAVAGVVAPPRPQPPQ
jgi:hypothetical protein